MGVALQRQGEESKLAHEPCYRRYDRGRENQPSRTIKGAPSKCGQGLNPVIVTGLSDRLQRIHESGEDEEEGNHAPSVAANDSDEG
jgi:hypothetical protein